MTQLIQLTKEMNAPKDLATSLTNKLNIFFNEVESVKDTINGINITSIDQVKEMQQAREIRLEIRRKRLKARDIVKDQRLKIKTAMSDFTLQDKLWLKAFQMLEATCDNLETKCEDKEKFAERYEAEQKQLRYESRVNKLHQYGTDPSIYALSDMSDEAFEKLLENERLAYNAKIEAEKKAELQRVAEEKAEKERQEEIKKENERLKTEAIEKERLANIEQEKREKELAKERAEQQKKLDAERKAREQAEAKIKAEKEAQAKKEAIEKARLDEIKKQQEEAERQKLLAPDKDKLMELAQIIDKIQLPAVSSKEANSVVRATEEMLGKVTNYIREKAKTL